MANKICLITGCNSGIGKATAIELAGKGYDIIMLVRNSEKSINAYNEIKQLAKGKVDLKYVDLASLKSIKSVCEEITYQYNTIDVLINNAGIFKRTYSESIDSFETTIAVNYIATYALTLYMIPLLKNSKEGRIVNLSSELYKRGKVNLNNRFSNEKFDGNKAYANSKLLVIYFTKALSERLSPLKITVNSVHPGVIGTDVFREYPKWLAKIINRIIPKPEEGARPSVYLASSDEVKNITGKYFNKLAEKETTAAANDMELSEKIWKKTEELTGVKLAT